MATGSNIAFNPITSLQNDKDVKKVFHGMLTQRFSTSVLSGYYKLGDEHTTFNLPGFGKKTVKEYIDQILDFLVQENSNNPDPVMIAKKFWDRFGFHGDKRPFAGVPVELDEILKKYSVNQEKLCDLTLIKDMIRPEYLPNGTVLDFGSGRNKLGTAILEFAGSKHVHINQMTGTDVIDYGITTKDDRHVFIRKTGNDIPLKDNTTDLVIIKWAFHHINNKVIDEQIGEFSRILSSKGRIVIIEALTGDISSLFDQYIKERENKETWPDNGKWFKEKYDLTINYLKLSQQQQKSVLAMKDYYGNWLEQKFTWMPMPFNYMTPDILSAHFSLKGFKEVRDLRRIFGLAPVIHWGPPTMRIVYTRA
jgi:ubiquinone/menaquinone biosynthesis C-methylase UbiE